MKKIPQQRIQKGNVPARMITPKNFHADIFAYIGVALMVVGVVIVFAQAAHLIREDNTRILVLAEFISFAASFFFLTLGITRLRRISSQSERVAQIMQHRGDRYARATFGSHEGMWDINPDTGEAFFSERWHTMLQLEADTVQSILSWQERIHPDDRKSVSRALSDHYEGLRPMYEAIYRIRTGNGSYVWVSDRGSISAEASTRIAGFSREITREKQVEEALQSRTEELMRAKDAVERETQNTKKFSQAVESATDPIAIITASGNITYTNEARGTLLNLPVKDMIGAHILAPYREKTPKEEIIGFELALRAGRPFASENFIGIKANRRVFQAALSIVPVREKGTVLFFTSREEDITKRKDIDRAKTEFVSLASHQLRTPLTSIRWYSEMLLKERERTLTDLERKYLREIYGANRRMIELINALLNVSRIDLGAFVINPHPADLTEIMESVLKEIGPQVLSKHITITKEIEAALPMIPLDVQLFRMVFQNLLSNAVKYTPNEGTVKIVIRREGDNILFSCADSGIGIPEKEQAHIFTKLFRADNARDADPDGTGLGLYIIHAIMEASGGEIRFESKEGKGTTFYGTIPIGGSLHRDGTKALT